MATVAKVSTEESEPFVVAEPVEAAMEFAGPRTDADEQELGGENDPHQVPQRHFRDGLFDCFNHCGICCVAFLCQPILLGQIMARYHLGFGGFPSSSRGGGMTPFRVFCGFVVIKIALNVLKGYGKEVVREQLMFGRTVHPPDWYESVVQFDQLLSYVLGPYFILVTYRVYREVARHSNVETEGCQSCLLATFCRPCLTAQLARHTANHHRYPYHLCNERGLPDV